MSLDMSEKCQLLPVRLQKGLEGPSHVSPAWNKRSRRKSLLKNPMSLNVTGVDIPVDKIRCDRSNQQRSKA